MGIIPRTLDHSLKRNTNLKEIIRGAQIESGKVKKNSIFPQEQKNALHVCWAHELYMTTKC